MKQGEGYEGKQKGVGGNKGGREERNAKREGREGEYNHKMGNSEWTRIEIRAKRGEMVQLFFFLCAVVFFSLCPSPPPLPLLGLSSRFFPNNSHGNMCRRKQGDGERKVEMNGGEWRGRRGVANAGEK